MTEVNEGALRAQHLALAMVGLPVVLVTEQGLGTDVYLFTTQQAAEAYVKIIAASFPDWKVTLTEVADQGDLLDEATEVLDAIVARLK